MNLQPSTTLMKGSIKLLNQMIRAPTWSINTINIFKIEITENSTKNKFNQHFPILYLQSKIALQVHLPSLYYFEVPRNYAKEFATWHTCSKISVHISMLDYKLSKMTKKCWFCCVNDNRFNSYCFDFEDADPIASLLETHATSIPMGSAWCLSPSFLRLSCFTLSWEDFLCRAKLLYNSYAKILFVFFFSIQLKILYQNICHKTLL